MEKIILKIFGEKRALFLFGIRPKENKLRDIHLAMNGELLTHMTSLLNKHS